MERLWFSGIIVGCHPADPGSIPGRRIFALVPEKCEIHTFLSI